MYYVYFLYCVTGELVYIGQSKNPKQRRKQHEKRLNRELVLGDDLIECSTRDEAVTAEVAAIEKWRPAANKVAYCPGSDEHTDEAKRAISESKLGRKRPAFSAEWRSKMGRPGQPKPEGFGAKVGAAMKGIPKTAEHRANLAIAQSKVQRKGVPMPEGHGAKISAGLKGKPHSEERKANQRLAQLARFERERKAKAK